MQKKFKEPSEGRLYIGLDNTYGSPAPLPSEDPDEEFMSRDWDAYIKQLYRSHTEYVRDIAQLIAHYPEVLRKPDNRGRTVLSVLKNAASYEHFAYLMNGSVIAGKLSIEERPFLAWGTTGNEAVHKHLKVALHTITQQHEARIHTKINAFALCRLLCHASALQHPTTSQRGFGDLRNIISGCMAAAFIPDEAPQQQPVIQCRRVYRKASITFPAEKKAKRAGDRERAAASWAKQKEINAAKRALPRLSRQAPKVQRKQKKRTVYTQKKERKPSLVLKRPSKSLERPSSVMKRPCSAL